MKKLLALILAAFMAATSLAGCGQTTAPSTATSRPAGSPTGELVVGNTTEVNGRFFTTFWGNNSVDATIKELLHGSLDTVVYQKEAGAYGYNSRVAPKVEETDNADGTKTFTFSLAEDMVFSDGSPITARDYVFSILFGSHAALREAGASEPTAGLSYVGYETYRDGSTKAFSGVRLLGDYSFSLTVRADKLPYYYDFIYAGVTPYPTAVIAPGCTVRDDGQGAYIDGPFTAALLAETVTKTGTGYLYAPKVVAGPYLLEGYDEGSKTAVLKANPLYYGDYTGQKPQIETLTFKTTHGATQIDELAAGSVGLLAPIGGKDTIPPGLDLVDGGKAQYVSYPRCGFGHITFHCNFGPTQFQSVRQSIAYLLDVPELARTYSGGYASVVYGWYGSAHWMAKENAAKIKAEFNSYDLDLQKAKELLIADGWTLNEKGEAFVEGTDALRYKQVDGALMPLEILWAREADNPVSDLIAQMLAPNMEAVGMKLSWETIDFPVIADNYYGLITDKDGNRVQKYHMYNLAINFTPIFEPKYSFSTDGAYLGIPNSSFIKDEELAALAADLNNTPSTDKEAYSAKWYAFQKRFNELLPTIPLYSDEYYTFFTPKLKGYETDPFWGFPSAILYARMEQ